MWSFEVPSPPCGMETRAISLLKDGGELSSEPTVWDGDLKVALLAKGQGIVFRAHRVGWRQICWVWVSCLSFIVPSPPCGMETITCGEVSKLKSCSEPTVWDGDE